MSLCCKVCKKEIVKLCFYVARFVRKNHLNYVSMLQGLQESLFVGQKLNIKILRSKTKIKLDAKGL